jgi:hypothetical protein
MIDTDELHWLARAPFSAAAYMHAHGWRMLGTTSEESLWTLESDGQSWEALLPLDATRSDSSRRITELLTVLSVVERRSLDDLIRDLRTAQSDVIRIRATPESESGTAPIEDALQIISGSRELLLCAAAAVDAPRAVLGKRKPDRAVEFVRSVRLSTEPGSFVVAMETPIAPDMEGIQIAAAAGDTANDAGGGPFPDPQVPFARRVTELLVNAIDHSLKACAEVASGERLTVFDSTVPDGVSANLLEALARLGGGSEASLPREYGIAVRWSYGRRAPEHRRSYVITKDANPVFSAAAASLRARQPEPEVTLVGTVVGLRRDDLLGTDTVTLSTYVSSGDTGRVRNVRLVIEDEERHQIVSRAYETREAVVVTGDLQPTQGQLTVNPVTDVKFLKSVDGRTAGDS